MLTQVNDKMEHSSENLGSYFCGPQQQVFVNHIGDPPGQRWPVVGQTIIQPHNALSRKENVPLGKGGLLYCLYS